MDSADDEEYAKLVRDQLDALGYNSASIPDTVLREFLRDFEQMDVGDGEEAQPLSYPTALSTAETAGVQTRAAPAPAAKVSNKSSHRSANPARPRKPRPRPPAAGDGHPEGMAAPAPDDEPMLSPTSDAEYAAALLEGENARATGAATAKPPVPAFEPAHWDAMRPVVPSPAAAKKSLLRSASAISPATSDLSPRVAKRPNSARPLGASPRQDLRSVSALQPSTPGIFTGSGVIIPSASITGSQYGGTPRKAKSDPVSMHLKRMQEWGSDSFLKTSTNKPRHVAIVAPSPPTPAPGATPRRHPNKYVVPTSKRRDELVWQTRLKMRDADPDAGGKATRPRSKQLHPNRFVPCTDKRRDGLRWAVRTEMAWVR